MPEAWNYQKMTNNYRYKIGIFVEYLSCLYLMLKGYRIIKLRYKTKVGEIDVLVKKNNTYVIVEVKYRKNKDDVLYAITEQQKKRLLNAGKWVMKRYNTNNIRFDAVLISKFCITHIENAFTS